MNPQTFAVIGLRLLAVYLFFQIIPFIGYLLYSIVRSNHLSESTIWHQVYMMTLYTISVILLFVYTVPIAKKIAGSFTNETVEINMTSENLLSIIIAGSAVFVIISTIPVFLNQFYYFIEFYQTNLQFQPEKKRFNDSIVGMIGVMFQIIVAFVVFIKSKIIARYWENFKTGK